MFSLTGPISLCVDLFVFACILCVFVMHSCCITEHGGVDLIGLKRNPLDLSSFSALTLLVGSFDS